MKPTLIIEFENIEEYNNYNQKILSNNNNDEKQENEENKRKKYYCNNKDCRKEITKAEVSYCLSNSDRFDGKVYCKECQQKI